MYWGQITLAATSALGIGYLLHTRGRAVATAVLAALVIYFVVRWTIAWAYRIRYWHQRGTRGVYTRDCGNCGGYVYRYGDNWILSCHRCGWTAGLPVVRWFTRSVPARQLRRTVVGPQLLAVILAVGLLTTGVAGEVALNDLSDNLSTASESSDPLTNHKTKSSQPDLVTETATKDSSKQNESAFLRASERAILTRTNHERGLRGHHNLSWSETLHSFALKHSQDMAEHGFYGHSGPNGESWESRERNISRHCGSPAAENIHRGRTNIEIRIYGSSRTLILNNAESVSRYAVEGWLNSQGHRQNMLSKQWNKAGIGVYTSGDEIFMTIIFC